MTNEKQTNLASLREYAGYGGIDTTYNSVFIASTGNITSLYQNGDFIKMFIPGSFGNHVYPMLWNVSGQTANDTMFIATFESSNIVFKNKATLAIQYGIPNTSGDYNYLFLY